MDIQLVADFNCINSEGPLWHAAEQRLYWSDIETGRMFWYEPATGKHEQCYEGDKVGGFTIQADGKLLLFRTKGNVVTLKNGKIVDTIISEIPDAVDGRFNDVIADPAGRVFAGTMVPPLKNDPTNTPRGKLYRIDHEGRYTAIRHEQLCPNGMAFSKDNKTFYYTSTGERTIWQYRYDADTGKVFEPRPLIVVDNPKTDGWPDGMTMDDHDHFWSARWGGSCVVRYNPQGQEVSRIKLPCVRVSCVTFGGPDYTDLYLSTAGADDRQANGATAGAIYRITGHGFRGRPEYLSRIGL